jgi:hypothetical protein
VIGDGVMEENVVPLMILGSLTRALVNGHPWDDVPCRNPYLFRMREQWVGMIEKREY